ncbi:MAG: hypothetical protein CW346_08185 [Bacillaceae bacterium]|jgi:DNA-binding transcriptional ArsR family regulator|nr:hypothetical protein [Bacillaceae bacterium]
MQRDIIFTTKPAPRYRVIHSLAINLFTEMIFVDYAVHCAETPSEWTKELAAKLSDTDKEILKSIRSVLAHGWVLRDFAIKKLQGSHPAHHNFHDLIRWLEHLDETEMTDLAIDGVISGLDYYHTYMEPMPVVEAILKDLGTPMPDKKMMLDAEKRKLAIHALLESWSVKETGKIAAVIMDPEAFRGRIIHFIKALWEKGYQEEWNLQERTLRQHAGAIQQQIGTPMAPGDMVLRITGMEPEEKAKQILNGSPSVTFVPCLHLGKFMAVFPVERECYVLFEPVIRTAEGQQTERPFFASARKDEEMASILEAIGDKTRLKIVMLLKNQPGLHTVQIAKALDIHQSTVSRQCGVLVKAGILEIRKDHAFKYFRLRPGWAADLSRWLMETFRNGQ